MELILMESIIIIIGLLTSVYAQFEVRPKNSFVIRGDPVVLGCTVTRIDAPEEFPGAQLWKEYYTDGSAKKIAIDDNVFPNYIDEFYILPDTKYNLKLMSGQSQLKHGGKYECQNVFQNNQNTFAEIIVLDSDPVCTSVVPSNPEGMVLENDRVTYSCQIRYHGRWAPIQIWTDKDGSEISSNVGDDNIEGTVVHRYISFTAKASDDGQKFKCQTKFGELTPPPGENEDTTIPSYDHTTQFDTLSVHSTTTSATASLSPSIMMILLGVLFAVFINQVHRPLVELPVKLTNQHGQGSNNEPSLPSATDSGYLNLVSTRTGPGCIPDTVYEAEGSTSSYEQIQQGKPKLL